MEQFMISCGGTIGRICQVTGQRLHPNERIFFFLDHIPAGQVRMTGIVWKSA